MFLLANDTNNLVCCHLVFSVTSCTALMWFDWSSVFICKDKDRDLLFRTTSLNTITSLDKLEVTLKELYVF